MQDNRGNPGEASRPSDDDVQRSKAKIEALRERELPQMVDWFDPLLLVKVGIRTVLSKTIGDYADQRPMQAAHDDPDDENVLCQRHDYRDTRPNLYGVSPGQDPNKTLRFDADGALWVDFIADLGDGFEATYAMAYLMAKSKLDVTGIPKEEAPDGLPAGEFLIFGGDLAYPDATIKEYNDRCVTPYNNAFQMKDLETPKRKLYFISGNHDWYDGLAAFTSVFCAARDRFSKGKGKKIGGWQCEQRRSYFALGLPYGWWVWGIDLALNVTIDDAQKDYFEMMSQRTKPGEKVIIILHAPLWQLNEDMTHLHDISELARNRGAEVVAVLAGDLHFYSRYHTQSEKLDLQLITSGGGGAFAHPTHQEPLKLKVVWPLPKDNLALPHREADYVDTQISFSAEQEYTADYTAPPPASGPQMLPPVEAAARRLFDPTHEHQFEAPAHFYPTRLKSRFLSLKNLWLPFHNRRLAIFLGVVYMLYAWVFQITVVDPTVAIKNAAFLEMEKTCRFISLPVDLDACLVKGRSEVNARHKRIFNPEAPGTIKSMRDEAKAKTAKPATTDPSSTTPPPTTTPAPPPATAPAQGQSSEQPPNPILKKFEKIWPEYLALWDKPFGLVRVVTRGAKDSFYWFVAPNFSPTRISQAMLNNPALFFLIFALWIGLVNYVDIKSKNWLIKWPLKLGLGTLHFATHLGLLLATNAIFDGPYQWMVFSENSTIGWIIAGASLYTFLMLMVGGFLGGAVFGLYSATTSFFGAMHMDAFSAIGIKDYKNFLRMRFDKEGGLTIYAIGLDKVPGRKDWRAIDPNTDAEVYNDHNPLIVPKNEMKPRVIDKVTGRMTGGRWDWVD